MGFKQQERELVIPIERQLVPVSASVVMCICFLFLVVVFLFPPQVSTQPKELRAERFIDPVAGGEGAFCLAP